MKPARGVVAVDDPAIAALKSHRTRQREERLALGADYQDEGSSAARPAALLTAPDPDEPGLPKFL